MGNRTWDQEILQLSECEAAEVSRKLLVQAGTWKELGGGVSNFQSPILTATCIFGGLDLPRYIPESHALYKLTSPGCPRPDLPQPGPRPFQLWPHPDGMSSHLISGPWGTYYGSARPAKQSSSASLFVEAAGILSHLDLSHWQHQKL